MSAIDWIVAAVGCMPAIVVLALGPLIVARENRIGMVMALWLIAICFVMATILGQNRDAGFPFWLVWSAMLMAAVDFVSIWKEHEYERALRWVNARLLSRKKGRV